MIKNFVVLTGEDDYRLQERVKTYKKVFREKYLDGEVQEFNKGNSFLELENTVLTPHLFGGRKLIFLEDFWTPEKFEQAEKTEFFIKLPECEESCTLVSIEPKMDKRTRACKFFLEQAKIEEFAPLDEAQTVRWIQQFAEKQGGEISFSCAQKLLNRCGENLWHLSREIMKLVTFAEGVISEKLIEDLTIPNPRAIIWDFLESMSRRSARSAMKRFRELLRSGVSVYEIFSMIQREVRIHAQIRDGIEQKMDARRIASETGLHPFVLQKTLPLSRQFSAEKIRDMYDQLFAIDQRIKTGKISVTTDDTTEHELAIEKFILDVCGN